MKRLIVILFIFSLLFGTAFAESTAAKSNNGNKQKIVKIQNEIS
jgi:hypothetical protein